MMKPEIILICFSVFCYSCTQENEGKTTVNEVENNISTTQDDDLKNDPSPAEIKNSQSLLKSKILTHSELTLSEFMSPIIDKVGSDKSVVLYCEWRENLMVTNDLYVGIDDISQIELGSEYNIPNEHMTVSASQIFSNGYPFLNIKGRLSFEKIDADTAIVNLVLVGDLLQNEDKTKFDTIIQNQLIISRDFEVAIKY